MTRNQEDGDENADRHDHRVVHPLVVLTEVTAGAESAPEAHVFTFGDDKVVKVQIFLAHWDTGAVGFRSSEGVKTASHLHILWSG